MGLLESFQTNKAISVLLSDQAATTSESKQAFTRLKKIGPSAIPKLIDACSLSQNTKAIESLLANFVSDRILDLYIKGLTGNQQTVATIIRVLSKATTYDPNLLSEYFSDNDTSKQALADILLSHKDRVELRQIIGLLDKVSASTRPVLYRLLDKIVKEDAIPLLINKTSSNEPMVRSYLASLISRFDSSEVQTTLREMLQDPNKNVRHAALQGLSNLGAIESVESIAQLLKDPDITVQGKAIETMIHINAPNSVKYLIDVLQDESEYVRRAAVEVLNEVGDESAIKDLLNALRDADWWVKIRAADALGSIGGPRVFEAVLNLIKDKDEFMRRTAVEILNTSKDIRAFDRLVEALNDEDWWVRERAVDALASIGDKRAVDPLVKMLKHSPKASQVVIRALATLGDKRAIEPIVQHLNSNSELNSRKEALQALQVLADEETANTVQSAVTQLLESPNPELNTAAAVAMKTLVTKFGKSPSINDGTSPDLDVLTYSKQNKIDTKRTSTKANIELFDASRLNINDVVFDRYRVIKQVGRGAFGVVVLVEDQIVHDQFILKFLNPQVAMDKNMIQRFTHELRYARKITHENVIRIYDFIATNKIYAISMEYFQSHSLAYELRAKKPLEQKRAINILRCICKGMNIAQLANVVHRDLKPGNILINKDNMVKIVDFGLAAAASHADSRLTKTGILVGTPTYMAPEQVRGKAIDSRTDIYALGVIMYEIFTGRAPYVSEETLGIMFQHVEGNATLPQELNPAIPDKLQSIIIKAMAIEADQRFQTFAELSNSLETIAKEIH